ncbi:MAG: NAD-dependent epimerase/dehydratase family protein, partial [Candidatus Heimdallarchaeota archaeon]
MAKNNDDFERCLVIGGAGMLGLEIAKQLHQEGKYVRILDIESTTEVNGIESLVGDIRNIEDVRKACQGIDIVFQTAAAIWDPKMPEHIYDEVNITGNQIVIDVCKELGIGKLVYTSTLDVVVDGKKPIVYG